MALTFAGCAFSALRMEAAPAGELAYHLIDLSARRGLPVFRPYGLIYQGWARAMDGGGRPAIAQIRTGLAEWRAMGYRAGLPFLVTLLVQALQHSGNRDEARIAVEEGLALATELGWRGVGSSSFEHP
jgi:hypothetical protein